MTLPRMAVLVLLAFFVLACDPAAFTTMPPNLNLTPQAETPEQAAEEAREITAERVDELLSDALANPGSTASLDEIDEAIELQPDNSYLHAVRAAIALVRGDRESQEDGLGRALGLVNEAVGDSAQAEDIVLGRYVSALFSVRAGLPKDSELYRRANEAFCRESARIVSAYRWGGLTDSVSMWQASWIAQTKKDSVQQEATRPWSNPSSWKSYTEFYTTEEILAESRKGCP